MAIYFSNISNILHTCLTFDMEETFSHKIIQKAECLEWSDYNLWHFEISPAKGGGGGLFGPDLEDKVMVNGLI